MSSSFRSCSFKSDSTYCSFYESRKKGQKRYYQTQTSYMNDLKEEIEKHFQGIQLLANGQIIMHLKKLKSFKSHQNIVNGLKRSLNLIYNQNKKFERMLSSDFQNGNMLLMNDSIKQTEILALLKPLFGDNSTNSSASFPSALLSNKNFLDSNATVTTETKTCSDVEQELCNTMNDITTNDLENFMDSDDIETSSEKTIIPNSLEYNMEQTKQSSYDSTQIVFNEDTLSNANSIEEHSVMMFCSDVEHQVVPNSPNVAGVTCIKETSACSQQPSIDQPTSYKKVFIFDSSSNKWEESECNIISSSENSQEDKNRQDIYFQCNNTMTQNAFPKSDNSVFKKPSNISIRRKVSSRSSSRKSYLEDEQKRMIDASYTSSSGEDLTQRDDSDFLGRQKQIISDTFDNLSLTDQNSAVKMATSSIQESVINDTYCTIGYVSGKSCQSEATQKGAFQFQSNENASTIQHFAEKEIISDTFSPSNNPLHPKISLKIDKQDEGSVKNEIFNENSHTCKKHSEPGEPLTVSSNTGAVTKDKSFVYEKSSEHRERSKERKASKLSKNNNTGAVLIDKSFVDEKLSQPRNQSQEMSISQLQKLDPDTKITSCSKDGIIGDLSHTFEKVMTLGQQHFKNNIYKKMLTDVEDLGPTDDPKATLDLARKLRGTFTLQYNQMVRRLSEDLMDHNNAWEDFEDRMRQLEEMLIQVEGVLPQVIQASLTERRLNIDSEFKEYLKSNPHNFSPEDLEEVNPHSIFYDNEAKIEEIAAIFRQQLKDNERLNDPVTQLDDEENFEEIVQMLTGDSSSKISDKVSDQDQKTK